MVLTGTFPTDSRVEKEAISLSENGHDVHIICYSAENTLSTEKTDYCTIHRVQFSSFFRNKLSALALLLPFFFLRWKNQIKKLYKTYSFDAVHIHDLPLSKVGYYFKKKYNCKLICDQHEFYSNWIKETAHMNTPLGKIISKLSNWEKYEEKYLNRADLVITVAKPLEENYLKKYGLAKNKIITVPNTPAQKIYNKQNVKKSIVDKYRANFILFYAGGIDILRGIDTAIIALKSIKDKIPQVKLVLGGRISKSYDPFKTAAENNVAGYLEFIGWIDEQELPSYISASDICFFTPPATRDEINKTIATKIYQYAIMDKPIIVSDAKMMKEYVEQNKLGISIETNNSKQFADAVVNIYNNPANYLSNFKGKNCYWEETVKPLVKHYSNF